MSSRVVGQLGALYVEGLSRLFDHFCAQLLGLLLWHGNEQMTLFYQRDRQGDRLNLNATVYPSDFERQARLVVGWIWG
jgi:hypothetical protein